MKMVRRIWTWRGDLRDLENADCIVVMGSNMSENHPIGFHSVVEAQRRLADYQASFHTAEKRPVPAAAPSLAAEAIAPAPIPTMASAMDAMIADSQRRTDEAEAAR